jgi:hypothetical protein
MARLVLQSAGLASQENQRIGRERVSAGEPIWNGKRVHEDDWTEFTYALWVQFAPEETVAVLKRKKLLTAGDDHRMVQSDHRMDDDPAASDLAVSLPAEPVDAEAARLMEEFGISAEMAGRIQDYVADVVAEHARRRAADMAREAVAVLLQEPNLRLSSFALSILFGLPVPWRTQREFAKDEGVTPQAVSKCVMRMRGRFDVPANAWCKSDEAREVFSQVQKAKHWRHRRRRDGLAA